MVEISVAPQPDLCPTGDLFIFDDVIGVAFHHFRYAVSGNWTAALVSHANDSNAVDKIIAGTGGYDLASMGGRIAESDNVGHDDSFD